MNIRDSLKTMMLGAFVVGGVLLIMAMILFLKPHIGDGARIVFVRFSDINHVAVGTRVTFAGKTVGEVSAIDTIYDARNKPSADLLGRIYYYQLTLKIDSSVKVYNTDEILIQTAGLLGEKTIAIVPKAPPTGIIPRLVTTKPIYGESVDPIENAFTELSELATDSRAMIKELYRWMLNNGDALGNAVDSFGSAMRQIDITANSINREMIPSAIKDTLNKIQIVADDVDQALKTLAAKNTWEHVSAAAGHIDALSEQWVGLSGDLQAGKGTMGQLLTNDSIYRESYQLLLEANRLLESMNRYGFFFNLDKRWQRLEREDEASSLSKSDASR